MAPLITREQTFCLSPPMQMSSAKVLFGAVVLALANVVSGEDAPAAETPAADEAGAADGAAVDGDDYLYKRPSAEDKFNGLDLGEGITVAFPPWLLVCRPKMRAATLELTLFSRVP